MRRRDLMALAGAAAVWPLIARAQRKPMPVIGILSATNVYWGGFYKGLNQTGFAEGKNVRFDYKMGIGEYEELAEMAADLAHRKVDVIVAFGSTEANVAKQATATIPIVFESGDPVAEGLVTNLARPAGNLTGISTMDAELMPKRLQLLSELLPSARVFALLVNPTAATAPAVIRNTEEAARASGIELRILKASTFDELTVAFRDLARMQAAGLIVDPDHFFNYGGGSRVTAAASNSAVPAIYGWGFVTEAGGLMSYGPNLTAMRGQIGMLTGRILNGEKPSDLPVEQPTKFQLALNLKTAKALGITVSQSILAQADEVIE